MWVIYYISKLGTYASIRCAWEIEAKVLELCVKMLRKLNLQ